ncbi:MAG TPA: Flp family type IVb pilin [Polyangia bacterium]|jgi:pilus assembly protein Flp/PilA
MRRDLKRFLADQAGATAVEYALILAAVAGLIMVVVFTVGGKVKNSFDQMQKGMP